MTEQGFGGSERAIEALGSLISTGRSSRFGFRRRAALRELGLSEGRGRVPADALRWERELGNGLGGGPVDLADIDRAVAREPGNPWWRAWRALGRLVGASDFSNRHLRDGVNRLKSGRQSRRDVALALDDCAAAFGLDASCSLARVAAALACETVGLRQEALAHLDEAVKSEPSEGWIYQFRSVLRLRRGDSEGFVADCASAIRRDEGAAYFRIATGIANSRPTQAALAAADRYLKREPAAYWMRVFRADCRRSPEVNDFAGSLRDLESAVEQRPDCDWAWAYLSRARLTQGMPREAFDAIDRAIALEPGCGWFRVWRGELVRRSGAAAASLADFDAGVRLDPDYELGYAWRGGARRAVGKAAEAAADLDVAIALCPGHAWTLHERCLARRAVGRTEDALEDLTRAHALDAKYRWCPRPERSGEAIEELSRELKRRPRSLWARAWRGEVKNSIGDHAGAAQDLRRALELEPGAAWARAWLGDALAGLGQRRQALRELDRAVARDPNYAPALARRGELRRAAGDLKAARADLQRAAAVDPKAARVWEALGACSLELCLWRAAEESFDSALELDAGNRRALLGRAQARRRLGDFRGALDDSRAALGRAADGAAAC